VWKVVSAELSIKMLKTILTCAVKAEGEEE
jgi:hypothetical protein